MDKVLHIVTHEIPWPVYHGGLTDLFYKIKSLHKAGVKIHLHCFYKKLNSESELHKYCVSVRYYKRLKWLNSLSGSIPYIVGSRISADLITNLAADDHPVLLEGVHCTALLLQNRFPQRKIFVRLHNVEHIYYYFLARAEKNIFKKIYFDTESKRLKKYEKEIASKATFITVSSRDANIYRKQFNAGSVHFLPVFIPYDTVTAPSGTGNYCLYHGNLSVNENEIAASWLLNEVFQNSDIPFIIAGRNPSRRLKLLVKKIKNVTLIPDPADEELLRLIRNAQIHLLPSFNKTGIKLKVVTALYNGRHILVNDAAAEGGVINDLCSIAETANEFKQKLPELFKKTFTVNDIQHRQSILQGVYDNDKNALHLMSLIW